MLAVSSLRQEDRCQTCLTLSLSLTVCLLLSLSLSLFVPAAVQILAFPHSSISPLCSTQLLHDPRHAERPNTHTHLQYHHTAAHTHLSWSSCRTRGGEKRVEEFGLKSCSCLQTAGKVELMSVCLSPRLLPSLSACLSVLWWFVNSCFSCCRWFSSQVPKTKTLNRDLKDLNKTWWGLLSAFKSERTWRNQILKLLIYTVWTCLNSS